MKHVIGSLAAALTLALAITVPAYGQQRQATPQADVVAAWQLREAGWTWDKIGHHVRSRGWRTVHPGVYVLTSSPVSRRVLSLLAVPFALGAVIYLCSLISPPPPAPVGNALAASPLLLILLAAMALSLGHGQRAEPDIPGRPGISGDT